jgi:hypothetical protein
MSKVKIQGNASGTGVVTLTAPNTNTDRTITLPDSTGSILDSTSTLDATKLSGALPAIDGSALTGLPAAGADTSLSNLSATGEDKVCQAWVNFNGQGTVSISDSYNVSSISDRGTGQYTVTFASGLSNGNYAIGGGGGNGGTGTTTSGRSVNKDGAWTTSSARIRNCNGGSAIDDAVITVLFFGK